MKNFTPEEIQVIKDSGLFDAEWYAKKYPDVALSGLDSFDHYKKIGQMLNRLPAAGLNNDLFSFNNGCNKIIKESLLSYKDWEKKVDQYLHFLPPCSQRLLIAVGHDASQTGAPNVIAKTLEEMKRKDAPPMLIVLRRGGILRDRFATIAPTIILNEFANSIDEEKFLFLDLTKKLKHFNYNFSVIINTVDSALFLKTARSISENVITLVHELGQTITDVFGGYDTMESVNQNSDAIVFPTKFAFDSCSHFKLNEKITSIVNPAIDIRFDIKEKNFLREKVRADLKFNTNEKVICMVGTFEPRKGFDLFVDVAIRLVEDCLKVNIPPPSFVWKGPENDSNYAHEIISKIPKGFLNKFRFLGPLGRAEELIAASDVFFLSSRYESLGIVALEAAAYGVPVVLFKGCSGAEEELSNVSMFAVDAFDVEQTSLQLLNLIISPQDLSEEKINKFRESHSYEKYADSIKTLAFGNKSNIYSNILIIGYGPPPLGGMRVEGSGLRNWGLAIGLKDNIPHAKITLAFKVSVDSRIPEGTYNGVDVKYWEDHSVQNLISSSDCVILSFCMGSDTSKILSYCTSKQKVILDCYVPIYTEVSARKAINLHAEKDGYLKDIVFWNANLKRGDYFLCANKNQVIYYTGILAAQGIINPLNYRENKILTVPYGVFDDRPTVNEDVLTRILKQNHRSHKKILWFGAVYPWFNINQLLEALLILNKKMPIVFIMVGAANPFVQHPFFKQKANELVESINKLGINEFVYLQDWVEYKDRGDWYLAADIIVTMNEIGIENELSWRTRLVDYVWSGAAIATNGGDPLGEDLIANGAAFRLNDQSQYEISSCLMNILSSPEIIVSVKNKLADYKEKLLWRRVVQPIASVLK